MSRCIGIDPVFFSFPLACLPKTLSHNQQHTHTTSHCHRNRSHHRPSDRPSVHSSSSFTGHAPATNTSSGNVCAPAARPHNVPIRVHPAVPPPACHQIQSTLPSLPVLRLPVIICPYAAQRRRRRHGVPSLHRRASSGNRSQIHRWHCMMFDVPAQLPVQLSLIPSTTMSSLPHPSACTL